MNTQIRVRETAEEGITMTKGELKGINVTATNDKEVEAGMMKKNWRRAGLQKGGYEQ
jgi:hypothetical protein